MAEAVAPFQEWLTALETKLAVTRLVILGVWRAYSEAYNAVVDPRTIADNRTRMQQLTANAFAQNAAEIAILYQSYMEYWITDDTAMRAYAAKVRNYCLQLPFWKQPPQIVPEAGLF